jgi:hypothetical protein
VLICFICFKRMACAFHHKCIPYKATECCLPDTRGVLAIHPAPCNCCILMHFTACCIMHARIHTRIHMCAQAVDACSSKLCLKAVHMCTQEPLICTINLQHLQFSHGWSALMPLLLFNSAYSWCTSPATLLSSVPAQADPHLARLFSNRKRLCTDVCRSCVLL